MRSATSSPDPCNLAAISADQAVFTSIRSAVSVGYRITAASKGLSQQERQEITQRCPSHASLDDEGPSAEALYAWTLRSGRYGVAWSRHAGVEHTGRGGYRVHTHVAVLDEPSYRRFGFHPIRVYTAMQEALGDEPFLEMRPNLDPLLLTDPTSTDHMWASALGVGCNREAIFDILRAALTSDAIVVTGLGSPFAVMEAVLAILPSSMRQIEGISMGLKYSPSRPAPLTVLTGNANEVRHLTRGQRICWVDAAAAASPDSSAPPAPPHASAPTNPPPGPSPARPPHPLTPTALLRYKTRPVSMPSAPSPAKPATKPSLEAGQPGSQWLTLARQWWTDGRRRDLCRLAGRITFKARPADLDRLATLCTDAEIAIRGGAAFADAGLAPDDLTARYADLKPANEVESDLLDKLRTALAARPITPPRP